MTKYNEKDAQEAKELMELLMTTHNLFDIFNKANPGLFDPNEIKKIYNGVNLCKNIYDSLPKK